MALTHSLTRKWTSGSATIQEVENISVDGEENREVSVAANTTVQVVLALDYTQIASLYMHSDQALTVESNDDTTPDDTINLVANLPLMWSTNAYLTNPFTANLTDLYLTNDGASTATFKLRLMIDTTP